MFSNIVKTNFNSELFYNKKYLKLIKDSTQKKAINAFIYQLYTSFTQFLENIENIIQKNF